MSKQGRAAALLASKMFLHACILNARGEIPVLETAELFLLVGGKIAQSFNNHIVSIPSHIQQFM